MSGELQRLAAACIFPGFRGRTVPEWLHRQLERGLGGVVLFARNVDEPERVGALTRALRAGRQDVLVAVDEEGGDVTRLEAASGSSYPGADALGVVDDVELTHRVAAAIGSDLAAAGINLNLAPVADVNSDLRNPIVGVRAFGSDPALVARHVRAFVTGLQGVGVAACAKHFPGHGGTSEDSHQALPTLNGSRAELMAGAVLPFRAAVEAGVRTVMTAHIRVSALDDAPATLSTTVIDGLLRGELGFDGVVMTDALEMRAISATVGVEEGAVRALAAGADALCLGADIGPLTVERAVLGMVAAVRTGALPEERLAQAAERVAALGRWASTADPDGPREAGAGLAAARRAVRADGDMTLGRAPLVVELRPEPSIAAGVARHGLGELLQHALPEAVVVPFEERAFDSDGLPQPDGKRRLVLVLRDAHRHRWQQDFAERLLARSENAIVVETGLPVWRPVGAGAYVATHGAGRVNLEAAAELLLAS